MLKSSETDDEVVLEEEKPQRRRYKAYTVMQRAGLQHTEQVSSIFSYVVSVRFFSNLYGHKHFWRIFWWTKIKANK